MIIDSHAHISDSPFGNVDSYIKILDEYKIDKAVIVPGGMIDVSKMSKYLEGDGEKKKEIPNHLVIDAVKKYPERLIGFFCVNPDDGKKALDDFDKNFKNGFFKGVKLAPIVHGFSFENDIVYEIAQRCADLEIPVYAHILNGNGASIVEYEKLVSKCGKTVFILGHMGNGPADMNAVDLAKKYDNLFLETSGGSNLVINIAYKKLGSTKLIFGSEFPLYHPYSESVKIKLTGCSQDEQENIFYKNIKLILKIN